MGCEVSAKCHLWVIACLSRHPRGLPALLRLPGLAAHIGERATASGQGNGLVAVVMAGR